MTKRLYESGHLAESKTRAGVWPIRIITEGKGSSGHYTRELLEASTGVFASRPMFGNHPKDPNKPWERSPFDIRAKLGSTVEYREVEGVAGLYAEAHVSEEVDKWLEEFHDIIGVSIYAAGSGEERDGEFYVTEFDMDDPYISVDFVVAPGRGGGVERVAEAYRALENGTADADSRNQENKEQTSMEIEELATKVDQLTESVKSLTDLFTPIAESLKPEEKPEVDVAAAVEAAIDKATEAGIPKELRNAVVEAAKTGGDVDAAITAQKAIVTAVEASLKTTIQEGVFGGGSGEPADYTVAGIRIG